MRWPNPSKTPNPDAKPDNIFHLSTHIMGDSQYELPTARHINRSNQILFAAIGDQSVSILGGADAAFRRFP